VGTSVDKMRRMELVEWLRACGDITYPRVAAAFETVPREAFVAPELRDFAYNNAPLPIGFGQTISQPTMVAIMTELLRVEPGDRILEVGTGSGYQAAILAELGARVITLERVFALAHRAASTLRELGYDQVLVLCADGSGGWQPAAPYDGILVTAAAPIVPPQLKAQLADGGRLIIPVGGRYHQTLERITRRRETYRTEESIGCVFVPLVGTFGFPGEDREPIPTGGPARSKEW
jgi:protein-L-isoaspartate(D-aspartate) O-methyltransferase